MSSHSTFGQHSAKLAPLNCSLRWNIWFSSYKYRILLVCISLLSWLPLSCSMFSGFGPTLSSLLSVYFQYQKPVISLWSHPCSPFPGSLHIIQLYLWHQHWPPRGHPNYTAFRTDLILLLPNLVPHPDAAVHIRDFMWLLILFCLQHPISYHRHILHNLQAACLPNVPTSLNSSFHRHPREHDLFWSAPTGLIHPPLLIPVTQPLSSQSSL